MTTPHWVQVGQAFYPKSQQLDIKNPAFQNKAMTAPAYQVEARRWLNCCGLITCSQILISITLPPIISLYFLNSISSHEIIKYHIIYTLILIIYLLYCLSSPSKVKTPQGQGLILATTVTPSTQNSV